MSKSECVTKWYTSYLPFRILYTLQSLKKCTYIASFHGKAISTSNNSISSWVVSHAMNGYFLNASEQLNRCFPNKLKQIVENRTSVLQSYMPSPRTPITNTRATCTHLITVCTHHSLSHSVTFLVRI